MLNLNSAIMSQVTRNRRKTILNVYFPNESETICERYAADTLKEVILKIGVEKVADACRKNINTPLNSNGVPLVTKIRNNYYGNRQHEVGDGWLVFTGTNTMVKKRQLEMLRDIFSINMRVSIV